jgi:hypothetical protein
MSVSMVIATVRSTLHFGLELVSWFIHETCDQCAVTAQPLLVRKGLQIPNMFHPLEWFPCNFLWFVVGFVSRVSCFFSPFVSRHVLPKFAIFVSHESIDLVPIIVSFLFHVISFHWQTVQSWGCRFPFLRICGWWYPVHVVSLVPYHVSPMGSACRGVRVVAHHPLTTTRQDHWCRSRLSFGCRASHPIFSNLIGGVARSLDLWVVFGLSRIPNFSFTWFQHF